MQLDESILVGGLSLLCSGCVAFGIVRGKLNGFLSRHEHADLCKGERKETETALKEIRDTQLDIHGKISEIHGYLKAKGL